jgi:hypothetical protein
MLFPALDSSAPERVALREPSHSRPPGQRPTRIASAWSSSILDVRETPPSRAYILGALPDLATEQSDAQGRARAIITVRNRARVYYENMERDKRCPSFCVQMVHLHQYTTVRIHPRDVLLSILQHWQVNGLNAAAKTALSSGFSILLSLCIDLARFVFTNQRDLRVHRAVWLSRASIVRVK